MKDRIMIKRSGLTLVETMIAVAMSVIVVLALATVMADGPRSFNRMYDKVNADIQAEAMVSRITFESYVRKSSKYPGNFSVDADGDWIEVNYHSDLSSGVVDRYAKFYVTGDELVLETGVKSPRSTLTVATLSENISSCEFKVLGKSVQMIAVFDDDSDQVNLNCSAVMNNP